MSNSFIEVIASFEQNETMHTKGSMNLAFLDHIWKRDIFGVLDLEKKNYVLVTTNKILINISLTDLS